MFEFGIGWVVGFLCGYAMWEIVRWVDIYLEKEE